MPNINNDWLIFAPYTILIPLFVVFEALYDPAKSTNDNFDALIYVFRPWLLYFDSTVTCNIPWDLEDA